MSNDLNSCSFIGRLGKSPESRYMASGEAVTSFSLAVGSQWNDKSTGEKKESVEWVSVTAFGKLGEICAEYLVKGSQVYISGRMKTDKYADKEGVERYSTKIIADRMQMLGSKGEQGEREAPQERVPEKEIPKKSDGVFDDFEPDTPF